MCCASAQAPSKKRGKIRVFPPNNLAHTMKAHYSRRTLKITEAGLKL